MTALPHSLGICPDSARNYHYIAAIHEKLGEQTRALENCNKALAIRPCYSFAQEMLERLAEK